MKMSFSLNFFSNSFPYDEQELDIGVTLLNH